MTARCETDDQKREDAHTLSHAPHTRTPDAAAVVVQLQWKHLNLLTSVMSRPMGLMFASPSTLITALTANGTVNTPSKLVVTVRRSARASLPPACTCRGGGAQRKTHETLGNAGENTAPQRVTRKRSWAPHHQISLRNHAGIGHALVDNAFVMISLQFCITTAADSPFLHRSNLTNPFAFVKAARSSVCICINATGPASRFHLHAEIRWMQSWPLRSFQMFVRHSFYSLGGTRTPASDGIVLSYPRPCR